jgi:hypothetical protein
MCTGAYAQFNQGRWLAGGSLGFSATTDKSKSDQATVTNSHSTDFSLTPDVGYFIIDNLAVGGALNLSASSTKFEGSSRKNSSAIFALAPFARYYLDPGIFFQAQVGFGSHTDKTTDIVNNATVTRTTKGGVGLWGIGVGYAYFLTDNVAIEPLLSYQSVSAKDKDSDTKDITSGIYFNVGFQIYLGPRN